VAGKDHPGCGGRCEGPGRGCGCGGDRVRGGDVSGPYAGPTGKVCMGPASRPDPVGASLHGCRRRCVPLNEMMPSTGLMIRSTSAPLIVRFDATTGGGGWRAGTLHGVKLSGKWRGFFEAIWRIACKPSTYHLTTWQLSCTMHDSVSHSIESVHDGVLPAVEQNPTLWRPVPGQQSVPRQSHKFPAGRSVVRL
jgi:hypothetical protein